MLQFAVENFTCFADRAVLSLLAIPEEAHPEGQILQVDGVGAVLRSAVVYGANASGKSNLVRAFRVLRALAVDGVAPKGTLPVEPHRLDDAWADRPTTFEIEASVQGTHYAYGLRAKADHVVEEWLERVDGEQSAPIFHRTVGDGLRPHIEIGEGLVLAGRRRDFYEFVAEGTRPEQPYLAELRARNATELHPLVSFLEGWSGEPDWALDLHQLVAILLGYPHARETLSETLREADTGVRAIRLVSDAPDIGRRIDAGEAFAQDEARTIAEGGHVRLEFLHRNASGGETALGLDALSDGTRRLLLGLGPTMLVSPASSVVFVDELDRSFHTALTRHLVRRFHRSATRTQFVFTTHDTNLLDASVFGRDAVWFVQKDRGGAAHLYSLAEFDRGQLDALEGRLEQGYLQGRFGAIPSIGEPGRIRGVG